MQKNKAMFMATMAIITTLSMALLPSVYAYTIYHGQTTSWAWANSYAYSWRGNTQHHGWTNGDLWAKCDNAYANVEAYCKSPEVTAQGNGDDIMLYVYWHNGQKGLGLFVRQCEMQVKLYKNQNLVGVGHYGGSMSTGFTYFSFNVNVQAGDKLSAMIIMKSQAGNSWFNGYCHIGAVMDKIIFYTWT